jgi:beta-glucosidase
VNKSLVLLKNDNDALPITDDAAVILVGGQGGNDIGTLLGGWSIEWQGGVGDTTTGTTIFQAVQDVVPEGTEVYYDRYGRFRKLDADVIADVGIAVVGETPYAEGAGDNKELSLSSADVNLIAKMRERCDKLIVVLISGRPLIITDQLDLADAFVAAWLPGTEGEGVVDNLFGYQPFTGKLSYTWPRSADQLPFDFANLGEGEDGPLFPFGYGLELDAIR